MLRRDWRSDPGHAARALLTIVNDPSAFVRAGDGRVVHREAPGDFVRSLTEAMLRADRTNLSLLSLGFPALARAVDQYKYAPQGLTALREQADWKPEASLADGEPF